MLDTIQQILAIAGAAVVIIATVASYSFRQGKKLAVAETQHDYDVQKLDCVGRFTKMESAIVEHKNLIHVNRERLVSGDKKFAEMASDVSSIKESVARIEGRLNGK